MKSALVFLTQLILLGGLAKFTIRMFIPRQIRILSKKAFLKSITIIKNIAIAMHDDFEDEDYCEEEKVVDFDKVKKSKAR